MNDYRLPDTNSLDEDAMVNLKGATNLLGPLILASFVIYGGSILVKIDGMKKLPELFKKTLTIFGLG